MINKTNTKTLNKEVKIFTKDLYKIRKLIEAEFKKISKAKSNIEKHKIENGIFTTEEGKMLAKDFTATFKAFVYAVRNIPAEDKEQIKKIKDFHSNNLDFLENYKSMFELHDEKELLETFLDEK